jgi:hypothetical protein
MLSAANSVSIRSDQLWPATAQFFHWFRSFGGFSVPRLPVPLYRWSSSMSDLWDYGTSSSGDSSVQELSGGGQGDGEGLNQRELLQQYMSSHQAKKYKNILSSDKAPEDLQLKWDGQKRRVDDTILVLDDDSDSEGFEAIWRKDKEAMAVPTYHSSDSNDSRDLNGRGGSVRDRDEHRNEQPQQQQQRKKRGRPPKNAPRQLEQNAEDNVEDDMDGLKAQHLLRACLQDDEVSSISGESDEDEDLRRLKEMKQNNQKRKELIESLQQGCDVKVVEEIAGTAGPSAAGGAKEGASGLIELRFVDSRRHEFTTDAVPTSTFDFPCSQFVAHAIEKGWIESEKDVLRFVFDDEALDRTSATPQMFDMEDGDTIDVYYK